MKTKIVSATSNSKLSLQEISDRLDTELDSAIRRYARSKLGLDDSELPYYFHKDIEIQAEENRIRIEVRAELSYDELSDMEQKLNKVIKRYSKDSYFEAVTSGIIEAFIYQDYLNESIEESTKLSSAKNVRASILGASNKLSVKKAPLDQVEVIKADVEEDDISAKDFFDDKFLTEFGLDVCADAGVQLSDIYIVDYNRLVIDAIDDDGSDVSAQVDIDMYDITDRGQIYMYLRELSQELQEDSGKIEEGTDLNDLEIEGHYIAGYEDFDDPVNVPGSEVIEVEIDNLLKLHDDDYYTFVGDNDDWASEDGKGEAWHSEEYPDIVLREPDEVVDDIAFLIDSRIPNMPGTYRVKGTAKLSYYVPDVYEIENDFGDYHYSLGWGDSVMFESDKSEVINFSITRD